MLLGGPEATTRPGIIAWQARRARNRDSLLAVIQEHRLQYGQPLDEPLHPDATLIPALGGPWSLIA